jgi:hypothetical protein
MIMKELAEQPQAVIEVPYSGQNMGEEEHRKREGSVRVDGTGKVIAFTQRTSL